jgi:hypothetical protein
MRRPLAPLVFSLLPLPAIALTAALVGDAANGAGRFDKPEHEARDEFIDAWEQSRRGTWRVEFDYQRRLGNRGRLDLQISELNRPPHHLVAGRGGLNGRVDGREVVCDAVDGEEVCAPTGELVSFEEDLAAQLAELRDALRPPAKWYAVEEGDARRVAGEPARCFVLRRIVTVPSPPYGERAEYCFASDGVPLLNRVERRQGTDQRVATEIRRTVTEADIDRLLGSGS